MFKQKTTFVIGAGASCELGLPSGEELKGRITALLAPSDNNMYGFGHEAILRAVKARLGQSNIIYAGGFPADAELTRIREASQRIRRGLPLALSIDNFLHTHQGDAELVRLGKTAIFLTILEAERQSAFYHPITTVAQQQLRLQGRSPAQDILSPRMLKTWYPPFAQLLMAGVQRQDFVSIFENLRFVIFNYDRCFEQYLWLALQAYFDLSPQHIAPLLNRVEFIHPYGSLGPLPWQAEQGEDAVAFGREEEVNVDQAAARIRTFTESVASDIEPRLKNAIEEAATIILLGFGYLDQNVQLLRLGVGRSARRIMSTAYGVSEEDQRIIRMTMALLGHATDPELLVEPGSCRDFFDRFRLQLSAG